MRPGRGAAADSEEDENDDSEDSDSDSDDDGGGGGEDETELLMRELEKIKAERAAERARAEEAERLVAERAREQAALHGNPLLQPAAGAAGSSSSGFAVKRRWDDDVIFKNQARPEAAERGRGKRFINDMIRSDFHRKFMAKFLQ